MTILAIDLETYSDVDIKKAGLYKYAENSEILLFAYAFDDEPVQIVDFALGEKLPDRVLKALWAENVMKTAYNASFEIHVINHWLEEEGYIDMGESYMKPAQWFCTMVQGYTLGLPGGLDKLGKVLHIAEDKKKLATGKRLIQFFSKPCKPTKANGGRTRNLPQHDMEKWLLFKEYCGQDVEAERAIRKRMEDFMPNEMERKLWCLDQSINDRGVLIDLGLATSAVKIDDEFKAEVLSKARELTGLDNPNSNKQTLEWIKEEEGFEPESLDKAARVELIKTASSERTKQFLQYKNMLGKTSVKKYIAMMDSFCRDGRVHGMLQFYGAARTGRWAGRLVQIHNLPRNSIANLDKVRSLVKDGDYEALTMLYDNPSDVLSQLIRTAFIAKDNHRFIVADFSAIEARVIAWLADEKWVMQAFAEGKDIYCATASQMFGVPVVKHGVNGELRSKGKIAVLACIAEGEPVLTDRGLVPIEKVTRKDKVWDGKAFVTHEGVIYKGEKDVFLYEGLRATADHQVYIEGQSKPIQFGEAACRGLHLLQTGDGGQPIRSCNHHIDREAMDQRMAQTLRINKMQFLRNSAVDAFRKSNKRVIKRLSTMLATTTDTKMARPQINCCKTALHQSKRCKLSELRRTRNRVQVSIGNRSRFISDKEVRSTEQSFRNRPHRHQWRLRTRKYKVCYTSRKQFKQTGYGLNEMGPKVLAVQLSGSDSQVKTRTLKRGHHQRRKNCGFDEKKKLATYCGKVKVYDIYNAGPNHRFTVSGKLVHNCGYGGGPGALLAFGADKMGLSDEDMLSIVQKWRKANSRIVKMWGDVQECAVKAIRTRCKVKYKHGIEFFVKKKVLFIRLPSGRCIAYPNPKIAREENFDRDGIQYDGSIAGPGGWGHVHTWGGKLVENMVQATARDCLGVAMLRLTEAGYNIVMHVHDEAIMEVPAGKGSLTEACKIMGKPINWAAGLLLTADGYETGLQDNYYRQD